MITASCLRLPAVRSVSDIFWKSLDEAASNDFIAQLHARKNEIYAELVASGQVTLRPGIARLIKEARRLQVSNRDCDDNEQGQSRCAA